MTQHGKVPEGWVTKPLNELVDFLDSQRRPIKSADRSHMRGQYPYYGASGIIDWVNDYLFDEELILLGEDGENILSRNLPLAFRVSGKVWVNNHAHVFRPKRGVVDIRFLTELLEFQDYADLNSGTAQPKLNKASCKALQLTYPEDLNEQEAIAEALSDADALIEGLERLIAKKRLIKHGAMQDLLTAKRRLPGLSGEWRRFELADLGEISGSGVDKKIVESETPVRLLNYTDVYRGSYISSNILHHWVTAPEAKARRCQIYSGDIFFTPTSETPDDIARSAVSLEDITDAAYSYHVVRLRLHEVDSPDFWAHIFEIEDFRWQARLNADGSGTRYVITLPKFRKMRISVPPKPERAAIGAILGDMEAEIQALGTRLAKARQVKEGMMQNLLTGRIRLV